MDQGVWGERRWMYSEYYASTFGNTARLHREWHEDREHEQHHKMLARVKEFDGDVDKLLAEYQHDIGIESGQPGECNQELKDCVSEPRRMLRRVPRQELLRMWFRVQVCLRDSLRGLFGVWIRVCIRLCLHKERKRYATALRNQLGIDQRDCEKMRPCTESMRNG